ncbi:MAG: hypothetical protein ACYCYI_06250 [Saccharofermentanales bacterium]
MMQITDNSERANRTNTFENKTITLEPIGARSDRARGAKTEIIYNTESKIYEFIYTNPATDTHLKYIIDTRSENTKNGMISIKAILNDHAEFYPAFNGGARYRRTDGSIYEPDAMPSIPAAISADVAMSHEMKDGKVIFTYTDNVERNISTKTYEYSIKGMTLIVDAYSDGISGDYGYSGFTTGKATGINDPRTFMMVFAEDIPVIIAENSFFMSTYIDKTMTGATSKTLVKYENAAAKEAHAGFVTNYDKNSKGEVNPLKERMYVTVSEDLMDCVYLTSASKSPYRDRLTELVVVEEWGRNGSFQDRQAKYRALHDKYKMEKVLYMDHVWQRDGYDISLPAHYPAASRQGGSAEMKKLIDMTQGEFGWTSALHEDYWFMYPSEKNQYWNDDGRSRLSVGADLNIKSGWFNAASGVGSYAIKAGEMRHYAEIETKLINDNYGTKAVYLDVNSSSPPDFLNQVTLDADSKNSKSIGMAFSENIDLFQAIKDIHEGPLLGEGYLNGYDSCNSIYAGYIDGVEREIINGLQGDIMPDYELKYIRPLMANQGMGFHGRANPDRQEWKVQAAEYDWDKYNTMAIVYGHTGYINNTINNLTDEIYAKTYYMFQAIQSQYLDTAVKVDEISYLDSVTNWFLDLNEAAKTNYDFKKSKIHIKYDNGLEIYANFSGEPWLISLNDKTYDLDKNGYAAANATNGFLQYSCLQNGNRVDFVDCKDYTFADARGKETDFGKFKANGLKIIRR